MLCRMIGVLQDTKASFAKLKKQHHAGIFIIFLTSILISGYHARYISYIKIDYICFLLYLIVIYLLINEKIFLKTL
jgi:hypothetical protein